MALKIRHVAGQVHVEGRPKRIAIIKLNTGYFEWVHGPFLWSPRTIFARVTPNYILVVYLPPRTAAEADEVGGGHQAGKLWPSGAASGITPSYGGT